MREVFTLAYPVVLTQISTPTLGVVDAAMVGRLGATELASVGFAGVWLWTLFSLPFGMATGVQTFVSQADGAGSSHGSGAGPAIPVRRPGSGSRSRTAQSRPRRRTRAMTGRWSEARRAARLVWAVMSSTSRPSV